MGGLHTIKKIMMFLNQFITLQGKIYGVTVDVSCFLNDQTVELHICASAMFATEFFKEHDSEEFRDETKKILLEAIIFKFHESYLNMYLEKKSELNRNATYCMKGARPNAIKVCCKTVICGV